MYGLNQTNVAALLLSVVPTGVYADGNTPITPAQDIRAGLAAAAPDRTVAALLSSYRGANIFSADRQDANGRWHQTVMEQRDRAQSDLLRARAELERAQEAVAHLLGEVRIEGADHMDIGGEIRAARMIAAEWQRAVDTVSAYIGRIDVALAERGSDVARND